MAYNATVESFRNDEYPMMQGKTYLDHGGTTAYARSLIEQFSQKMISNLYGNPHSESDPARLSSRVIQSTREAALAFFGADPEHFDLIFTANATAAIKLVGESFQDLAVAGSTVGSFFYGYHKDAHTSILGVRELTNGTHHCFTSDQEVEEWLDGSQGNPNEPNIAGLPGLFAYPGQSNMTGRRLPLSWTRKLRQSTKTYHQNTYSLLDAAALATTSQLDFSDPNAAPDFTALSFYKIFGFPDLGALIVRKKSGHILSWRRYFGGGTVNMVTVHHEPTVQRKDTTLHDALEDGTLPFHSIVALGCAIDVHKKLYGSMITVSRHTTYLGRRLYLGMTSLQHSNGLPVCVIHTDAAESYPYDDPTTQGSTVAFSIIRDDGTYVGHSIVEKLANEDGIYVRSGGLCNAGGISSYLKVEPWQFKRAWSAGHRCGDGRALEIINGKPTGVVRASLGAMSTLADVDTFLEFLAVTFETRESVQVIEQIEFDHRQMENNFVRNDSGFHSRTGSSTTSPVLPPTVKKMSSVTNLTQTEMKPRRLHPQQSFYSSVGRHDMGRVVHLNQDVPIPKVFYNNQPQVIERRPYISREPARMGALHYSTEAMMRDEFRTIAIDHDQSQAIERRPYTPRGAPKETAPMGLLRDSYEAMTIDEFRKIAGEGIEDGKKPRRGRFRFWRGKRTEVGLVSVS